MERQHRPVEVAYVDVLAEVDRAEVCIEHGHASAKVMMAHVAQLSGGVAMARDRVRRMIAVADKIDQAWRAGELGVEQARLLGRVYANVRVRDAFLEQQDWFLRRAGTYASFGSSGRSAIGSTCTIKMAPNPMTGPTGIVTRN